MSDYPHIMRGMPRKGDRCRILPGANSLSRLVQVQFEDGKTAIVKHNQLRRAPEKPAPAK